VLTILKQTPSVDTGIRWFLYLVVALVVLIPLAYFALLPIAQRLRRELTQYLDALAVRQSAAREARKHSLDTMASDFQKLHILKLLNDTNRGLFERAVEQVTKSMTALRDALERHTEILIGAKSPLSKLTEGLSDSAAPNLKELPSHDASQVTFADLRVAHSILVVLSILLIGILLVNTGMLSQIVRDLGFIPQSYSLLGAPLYVLFALLLTLFEAGVGVAYDVTKQMAGKEQKIAILPIFLIFLAVIIACVEGFFYSQVAPNKDSLVEFPFIGYQMKQGQLFFLWGFALVTSLFVLGSQWFHALSTVRRGNSFTVMQRQIRQLSKDQESHAKALERSASAIDSARNAAEEASQLLDSANSKTTSMRAEIKVYLGKLFGKNVPEWACMTQEDLSPGDVQHLSQQAGVAVCFIVMGSLAHVFTGYRVLISLHGSLAGVIGLSIAFGLLTAFLAAGVLFRGDEKVVSGASSDQLLVSASLLGRGFGITLAVLLVGAYLAVLLRLGMSWPIAILWLFNLILGVFLGAVAYNFYPLVSVSRLWFRAAWNLIASALERFYRLLVHIGLLISIVVEYIGLLLSAPIYQLLRRPIP
jgi:hypothetical protein